MKDEKKTRLKEGRGEIGEGRRHQRRGGSQG